MTSEIDRRVASLAATQAGRVGRRQLLAEGFTVRSINRRVSLRRLRPTLPGVYAVGPVSTWLSPLWAAYLFAGPDSVLSHRAAAILWRIARFRVLDVTLDRNRRGTRGLVCHRATVPANEVTTQHGLPVTTPARTLLDLASTLPEARVQPIFTAAEVQGRVDQTAIRTLLSAHPRSKGAVLLRRLAGIEAGHVRRGRIRSRTEVWFRSLVERRPDWPAVEFNAHLLLGERVVEIDALLRSARPAIEIDGAPHESAEHFHSDRERDRLLLANGYRPVRITERHLERPAQVEADLDAILGTGGAAGAA